MRNEVRPAVFVSATTRDLGTVRRMVANALLSLGCTPVEQASFPPDARTVREMLRARLQGCHAVIHIAGRNYGGEPSERLPGEPRRSYTQLEVDMARELGKPVYVFVCSDDFPYDSHESESEDLQRLQQSHRETLMRGDRLYDLVSDAAMLERRVLLLQERVDRLRIALENARRRLAWAIGVSVAFGLALGLGIWLVARQTDRNTEAIARVQTQLESQRQYISAVATAYQRVQAELRERDMTPEEIWLAAIESVAEEEGLDPQSVRDGIDLFVAAVRSDPAASFIDLALADFAERDFGGAADNAANAAESARARREAAEDLVARAAAEADEALVDELGARVLESDALQAAGRYEQAAEALRKAIAIVPREESPDRWAELQRLLGNCLSSWSGRAEGSNIQELFGEAETAYMASLEVFSSESTPDEWVEVQFSLADARCRHAQLVGGPDRERLLRECLDTCAVAQATLSLERSPETWLAFQRMRGNCLTELAQATEGTEKIKLFEAAIAAQRVAIERMAMSSAPAQQALCRYNLANTLRAFARVRVDSTSILNEALDECRQALVIFDADDTRFEWAATQNLLGIVLSNLGLSASGVEQSRLYQQALEAYRAALTVQTREVDPQGWAMTQYNIASALHELAGSAPSAERNRWLEESVAASRLALEVLTKDDLEIGWMLAQTNIANTLADLGSASEGESRVDRLVEAVARYREVIEVATRAANPHLAALNRVNLGQALGLLSDESEGEDRLNLLDEAVEALVLASETFTSESDPFQWYMTQSNLSYGYLQLAAEPSEAEHAQEHYGQCLAIAESIQDWGAQQGQDARLDEAIPSVDSLVGKIHITSMSRVVHCSRAFASWLLDQGSVDEALAMVHRNAPTAKQLEADCLDDPENLDECAAFWEVFVKVADAVGDVEERDLASKRALELRARINEDDSPEDGEQPPVQGASAPRVGTP